jgi:ABC-type transport system substrate-binding protein
MAERATAQRRELVAADVKYCFEAYAKEGVQAFTFQEIEGMETPDTHTLRIYLKTPNTLFPQNVAEPVAVIFSREVLEEDGDLKKRLIGTGPYILKEPARRARRWRVGPAASRSAWGDTSIPGDRTHPGEVR